MWSRIVAEKLTTNYGWTKPDPGASPYTWGATQNATTDKIDAAVYANQLAAAAGQVPLGGVIMWPMVTLPTGWTWCLGQPLSRTDYAALWNLAQGSAAFGPGDGSTTFNLPSLGGRSPLGYDAAGWSMGLTGGEINHTLSVAEMPYHTHDIADPGHAHSVYDPSHIHGVGDPGHNHGLNDPGHAHGASQDAHSHGLDHQVMTSQGGANGGGGTPWAIISVRTDAQQPAVHISGSGTGCYNSPSGTGVYLGYAATGIQIYNAGTGISIQNTGGGAAHNNMHPYFTIGFIIRIV